MTILWRDAMTVGVSALDNDHKKLISLVNMTEKAVDEGNVTPLGDILEALLRYCGEHFEREEAYMAAQAYGDAEPHARGHQTFTQNVQALRTAYGAARTDAERRKCATSVHTLLQNWLLKHVLVDDLKLKPLSRRKVNPAAATQGKEAPPATSREVGPEQWERRERDERRDLPAHLSDFLRPLHYVSPQPAPPRAAFLSKERLCEGAIADRVEKLLTFFHRSNDTISRGLPIPFIFAPEFAEKLVKSLQTHIFPQLWTSRRMRLLDTDMDWSGLNTGNFWTRLGEQRTEYVVEAWTLAWDRLRLIKTSNDDGTTVMKVKENTRALRTELAPPAPEVYELPKIGNREIDVFVALLDPTDVILTRLERLWSVCEDLYVQEMTPRGAQQGGMEGAFRDSLVSAFTTLPDPWGDFFVLTCHRIFPRISTFFLESFATHVGRSESVRETRMPYTMRYLRSAEANPDIRERELHEEAAWQANMDELQKLRSARFAGMGI